MRTASVALVVSLAGFGSAQAFSTRAFATQQFHSDEWPRTQKYGATEQVILKMGHDRFVTWFCDPSRAGASARLEAERVYCLALSESSAPLLLRLSRKEQKFMEEVLSSFADLAKSAFVAGQTTGKANADWSLVIAQSNTAIARTAHALLNPRFALERVPPVPIDSLIAQIDQRTNSASATASDAGRLKILAGNIAEIFKGRTNRERELARSFTTEMLQVALLFPRD